MNLKEQVGKKAVEFIKEGMVVGLGTGSTVYYFIHELAKKIKEGLNVELVSTSVQSINLAKSLGLEVKDIEEVSCIDISVDGVDEIDKNFNAIKGGGAALFREKIVADISNHVVWIYDEKKDVEKIGAFDLPVEILPFAYNHTIKKMEDLHLNPKLRHKEGKILVTDNSNYIVDLALGEGFNIEEVKKKLSTIVGVVEDGLFINMCKHCIKGTEQGAIIIENHNYKRK